MPGFLDRLARRERIPERVVVVVAHPDDEVLAAGSRMNRMENLTVIHLTDGAPRDMEDARRLGLSSRDDYGRMRRREVVAAMDALGADPELLCYWHPDKEAILHGPAILDQLVEDLGEAQVVITHAYEHGHPDHDTAALGVRLALRRLSADGREVPGVYEFPIYAIEGDRPVFGRFHPDPKSPETVLHLTEAERARRDAALAEYRSQSGVLGFASQWEERLRPAPLYDFRQPAPQGLAWYDRHGWDMTLARWREHANALLDREGA
ncbi:PIG-L deacetylase family protein [Rubellimicrobium roseum]|uniref:PIG-L deacetylase family protein n=1 Tax=Rubellimicrobium roseum TaxID=687525 RepID=UPI00159B9896|nr:PIG-L family deacetylase [Rubellimicrobium roseum]